jgi:hypothetical protein
MKQAIDFSPAIRCFVQSNFIHQEKELFSGAFHVCRKVLDAGSIDEHHNGELISED